MYFLFSLSDESGDFSSALDIGVGSKKVNPIDCIIPADRPASSDYQIRVVSSDPYIVSENENFIITSIGSAGTYYWSC